MRKRATKQLFQLACVVAEMAIFVSKVWTTIIMECQCCNVTAKVELDINASCCQAPERVWLWNSLSKMRVLKDDAPFHPFMSLVS
jgi:hypothetical protein